ncbi:hypothetical protein [Micromonospora sp. NPDC023814]|uniref:hypothetical protein n=1 Tax=Micromonospora sp. NPDC023814 TaxID=3154596 RepID=UPI0034036FA5
MASEPDGNDSLTADTGPASTGGPKVSVETSTLRTAPLIATVTPARRARARPDAWPPECIRSPVFEYATPLLPVEYVRGPANGSSLEPGTDDRAALLPAAGRADAHPVDTR